MAEPNAGLFNNPLFLQYLSGAGGAISQGQPIGPTLNDITQQNISSQSYMKLLQKLLGGGGKMTLDKDTMNIKAPVSALQETQDQGQTSGLGSIGANSQVASTTPQVNPTGVINPSVGPPESASQNGPVNLSALADISPSDLAGLSPQDISNALSGAIDTKYRQALISESEARTEAATPSVTVPETSIKLTRSQYLDWYKTASKDERTAAIKEYEYAKDQGFEGNFEDFQDKAKTTNQKDYKLAVEGGYEGGFNEWLHQMRRAGATRISLGEKVETAEALGQVKSKQYFTDPKGLSQDVDKYIDTEEVQNELFTVDPSLRERTKVQKKEQYIRNRIIGSGGEIQDAKLEGRNFIFTVKWPDGKTSEVRYAN